MGVIVSLALVAVGWPTGADAHPGEHIRSEEDRGIGVEVNSPEELAGFRPATKWSGTAAVEDQTADLVYAGTGCSSVNYLTVDVEGEIALVDKFAGQDPTDQCSTFTFKQKMDAAEQAGAIGLVQIDDDDNAAPGNAVESGIPGLEIINSDGVPLREAVLEDTAVNVTLTNKVERHVPEERLSDVPCVDGTADVFDCDGVDLLAFVPHSEFNGGTRDEGLGQSDLWGWTDPANGDEYVMLGKTNGVAFFRVTDPTDPVYLGELPNEAVLQRIWHDIKVYAHHAFIVSESEPHGMRVFDLRRLRDVDEPQTWDEDAFYPLHSAAHNVEVNTRTGYAYIVGGNAGIVVPDQCLSGLHMVDISTPTLPKFAGCYDEEGGPGTAARSVGEEAEEVSPAAYVHDAQCVVYDGPDRRYTDREICFNSAEDKVVVVDVTDKLNPVTLGVTDYPQVGYTHQGWLTEDHAYLLVNDEFDEIEEQQNTRTVVIDVTDLENPKFHFEHFHDTRAITHNNYVKDRLVYQSNYTAGLRVLDTAFVADPDDPRLEPLAFFDTYPAHGEPEFEGTWSNYPYFPSGTIAVSGIDEGLFLLRLNDDAFDRLSPLVDLECANCPVETRAGDEGTAELVVTNNQGSAATYRLSVDGLPDGWSATVDPDRVSVEAWDTGEAAVEFDVPRRTAADTYRFTVTATSVHDPEVTASEEVEVHVRRGRPANTEP